MEHCILTDKTTQGTSGGTIVTHGATGTTTSTLQTDLQTDQGPPDGTPVFTFGSLTDEEMAHLGAAVLPVEASPTCSTPPPTYAIIFDNLDFFVRTHHQSVVRGNKSLHWIHHLAVEDRVPSHYLSKDKPTQPIMEYDIGDSLPGPETQAHMCREHIVLGSRILTQHLDAFKPFSRVVVRHIPHEFSKIMSEASTHYPLGILFKDENKSGDLVDVLQHLQKEYAPKGPDGLESILVGGDWLTEGNSSNLQWSFAEGESVEDRLEGLVFKFEDWHAIRNLFEIYHKVFFKEGSERDHGTLLSNMNRLRTILCADELQPP
ncbi:uncharacterized protein V3H82_022979 [Fundulus diaphanus]